MFANGLHWMISRDTANMNLNPRPICMFDMVFAWSPIPPYPTGISGLVLFRHHFLLEAYVFGHC